MTVFYSIGHSTRTIEEFVALLRASGVRRVVDVRTVPRSRTNPQYNRDALPETLAGYQIGYTHIAALGGRRGRTKGESPNGYWRVKSFQNYADHTLTPAFAAGLAELRELGAREPCAMMCAEAVWWRCHRRIITDWLIAAGEEVQHILGPGHVDEASLTPGAVVGPGGVVTYPPEG
ncbi:DUF488 family protein [Paracoccus sp. S-4012]|uniref:DUF488 domain-containing protein n=1 Tax=Paracoccus sp. S-4012 TaxID=2665648 RepID=UPI0012B15CFA|nr:DUF488 domain-containing protein [Paracoccus sp. S-4012]MRX49342.1 DUF488 family protein [Paracoccus sp. S-4012]